MDIRRVQRIQRLTQEMGVNLAGVELILRLLDEMEDVRKDMEKQLEQYVIEAERRISQMMESPLTPIRRDERLLPVPNIRVKKVEL
jgi:MerR family transcriptional regulator/heat shock protein HspR